MANIIPTSYGLEEHSVFKFNRECNDCLLSCKKAVGGAGPIDLTLIKLIVISDYPGFYEKAKGHPFVNNQIRNKNDTDDKRNAWLNAGALIRSCLVNMFQLNTYNDCYMTNVIKCDPGKNTVTSNHLKVCSKYIKEELNQLDLHCPKTPILIAGNKAFKSLKQLMPDLISTNYGLQDCRRREGLFYNEHPLVFTVNPAAVSKSTFRIETEVYTYDELVYVPTYTNYPILEGGPVWVFCKDLELLNKYL
jgi:uracil-DNA glycosylase family 4